MHKPWQAFFHVVHMLCGKFWLVAATALWTTGRCSFNSSDNMDQGIISNRLFGQDYLLCGRRSFIQMDAVPLALRFRELMLDHFIYQCRCNLDFNKTFFLPALFTIWNLSLKWNICGLWLSKFLTFFYINYILSPFQVLASFENFKQGNRRQSSSMISPARPAMQALPSLPSS